jgi:hypothetical protein
MRRNSREQGLGPVIMPGVTLIHVLFGSRRI